MSDREETAMQQKASETASEATEEEEDEDEAGSPFDHPAFLPVLLFGMALWFGYDGWYSETIESVRFNRYGFFFLLGASLYFTVAELTRFRYLLPALFLAYAVWLGAFDLLPAPGAWWKNTGEDANALLTPEWFNRYGALVCLAAAAVTAFREWRRGGAPAASATS